ncbi:MAG: ATPase [Anaerolineae bacterium]|nr:ATPase [Anaerolineae bacterium]
MADVQPNGAGRVRTGVPGLDEMLGGGFLPQSCNLIEGAPGTGKSTLGLQFIYAGAMFYDEPGIVLTFEQFPQAFYRDAHSLGWDLADLERRHMLRVLMTSPEVGLADLQTVGGRVERLVREIDARRIMVDSISRLEGLAQGRSQLRGLQYGFINALRREGITAVLISEGPSLLGGGDRAVDDLAFVVDSYVLLRYVEIDSAIHRALTVVKMRGSDHAKDIRQYEITSEGIRIQSRFRGREGILSGSPHRMADSFMRAFLSR